MIGNTLDSIFHEKIIEGCPSTWCLLRNSFDNWTSEMGPAGFEPTTIWSLRKILWARRSARLSYGPFGSRIQVIMRIYIKLLSFVSYQMAISVVNLWRWFVIFLTRMFGIVNKMFMVKCLTPFDQRLISALQVISYIEAVRIDQSKWGIT